MRGLNACLRFGSAASLLWAVAVHAAPPSVASSEQMERTAIVRNIHVKDSIVSGVLVNNSPRLLRDVRLMVHHTWHWKNERHPGDDNPGRTEDLTITGEASPGGTLPFTYNLKQPLPQRNDGHFVTTADVIGFTEVGK